MRRDLPVLAVAAAIGIIVGGLVGSLFDSTLAGAVTGAFLGVVLGMYLLTRQSRWWLAVLLLIVIALAAAYAGIVGLICTIASAILALCVSALASRDLFGATTTEWLAHHVRLLTGSTRTFQIIDEGKITVPKTGKALPGPILMVVRPGNAIVTVKGKGMATYGSDIFTSAKFEFVKSVFDLREQQRRFTFDEVLTSDLMRTVVKLHATYALHIAPEARRGAARLTEAESNALRTMAFTMPDWQAATHGVIEQAVRQALRALEIDAILKTPNWQPLEQRLLHLTNQRTTEWGVKVNTVIVESIIPAPEITTARDTEWRERARAEGIKDALAVIAEGYKTAKEIGMSPEQIEQEVLRRTLEQIARNAQQLGISPPDASALLRGQRP